ncbi:MAG TPA: TlpA disulfide reductase family protein [Chloroflexota bacterium]
MRRSVWAAGFAIMAILLTVLLATGFSQDPNAITSPLIQKPASSFALRSIDDGRFVSLAQLRGRPVVLNFSASWCLDCRVDQEYLSAAWHQYRDQHVAFVSVLYQDTASAEKAFIRKYGGGWPVLRDPEQRTAISYGVYGVPETFFIDRRGIVRYKSTGPVPWNVLNTQIHRLLRSQA